MSAYRSAAPTLPLEPFDDVEAGRLYVKRGAAVSVTPDDSGNIYMLASALC